MGKNDASMPWIVRLSKEAERDFERLPRDRQKAIARVLDRMKDDPFSHDTRSLKGKQWKGRYRTVVGRYRIIFIPQYQDRAVDVVRILIRTEKTYR